jgi:hypothetical protein
MTEPLPYENPREVDAPSSKRTGGLGCLYRVMVAVLLLFVVGMLIMVGFALSGVLLGDADDLSLGELLASTGLQMAELERPSLAPDDDSWENAPPQPLASPSPQSTSRTQARLAKPARIRITEIEVDRAIIALPPTQDPKTGDWYRDVESLFRTGRNDLVGHWGGSSLPGQTGNMILVGHNYGYSTKGVFLHIGRLQPGQEITVLTRGGTPYVYRVKSVDKLPWRRKDLDEMIQHSEFLATGGEARLTLVTCGGASRAPFPQNIYVVAEPVNPGQ